MSNATATIEESQVLNALRALQQEEWPEVLDFIGYLRYRNKAAPPISTQLTADDLAQSDLVGIWADRTDMTDSLAFARQLRNKAERRWEDPHDPA
jgi:hypothetical protein